MADYTVHDEPGFARVYDEDETIEVRRGDLRALLDLATGSMNFGSGFWDNESAEVARVVAVRLGIDPAVVTPDNLCCSYGLHDFWTAESEERNRAHIINFLVKNPKYADKPDYSKIDYGKCKRWHCHERRLDG